MSDQIDSETSLATPELESSLDAIERIMDGFLSSASVDAVYQKPVKHGETLIISASEVFSFVGFGLGIGKSSDEDQDSGLGAGGGGGGSVHTRPVAVIVSTPEGVEVEPVFDLTKIAVTALATGVMIFGMMARLAGLRRKVNEVQNEVMNYD